MAEMAIRFAYDMDRSALSNDSISDCLALSAKLASSSFEYLLRDPVLDAGSGAR